ncbi:protein kinase family protein [Myceligenerans pegani]|uniref:Protein kinase family protein n=1 Tax=Myceligenerans pegani TaxID=2776917 RepID=A0ABR9N2R6_9MICO|nr:protein kinase family protein [Myceligenerans sp. TRM 65318]MBE1877521.1 protein kinase family protein [Myceligenerans sp. TRM 65318]MBE3019792.1 protein kinase family protein [Myceligenerans sp. TRM 65318]
MSTPGPGDVLVDRYRLGSELRTDLAAAVAWEAHDQVLDRRVRLTLVSGPWAADALDSARRAALVTEPRINRVLDAGTADIGSYVVTEPYPGETLTDVVSQGLVDEQQARAIAGEVASALAAASARGVHHTVLRPEAIRVDRDRVVVTGLGLDGGLASGETLNQAPAAVDAQGALALIYYAMTARWPGIELEAEWIAKDTVIPLPARRDENGAVVALSTLVPHVDPALDALLSRAFDPSVETDVPSTPDEVVTALEPWGEVSVLASLPAFVQQEPEATERPAPPAPPVRRPVVTGRIARAEEASAMSSVPPEGAPQGYPPPHSAVPPPPPGYQPQQQTAQQTGYQQPPQYAPQQYAPQQSHDQQQYPPSYESQYAAQPQAYATPPGYEQQYYDQNQGFRTQPAPKRGGVNPTPIVLGVVGVAVVAGLIWAVMAILAPSETRSPVGDAGETAAGEAGNGGGEGEGTGEGEESEAPETEARPVITGSTLVGTGDAPLEGDDADYPETAPYVSDGDPTTFWYTRTFASPDFGGFKSGTGVALTLQEAAAVSTIELSTNSEGGNVQIRATTPDDPAGGQVVAEGPVSSNTTFELPEPVVADSFVIWFTSLPESDPLPDLPDLRYRIELNEVTLS